MKHKILILLLFFAAPAAVFSQTLYTVGVTFCASPPSHNPGTSGAKYAIDTTTWDLYVRSYGTTWTLIGNNIPQDISGCSAPAYTPTKFQSKVVINACSPAEMYIWDGSAWNQVGGAAGLTGTGLATRIAAWTASGALGYDVSMVLDTVNNRMGVNTQAPVRTLHVTGEARISDLTTDTPTRLVGADADGDLGDAGSVGSTQIAYGGGNYLTSSSKFTYDNSVPIISLSDATASAGVVRSMLRNTTPDGYSEIGVYNNTTENDKIVLGISGSSATFEQDRGYIACGSNVSGITYNTNATSSTHRFRVNSSQRLEIADTECAFSGSSSAIYQVSNRNSDPNGYTNFTAYNNTSATFADRVTFGIGGNAAGFSDYTSSGYVVAGTNVPKLMITASSASGQINFRTTGELASNNRMIINSSGNVSIGTNFTPAARLDVRGSGTTSAASALDVSNSNDSTILLVRNDRRVGINTATPDVSLDAGENTDQIKLPGGTTAQRAAVNNSIRYNSDVEGFEARENGVWFRLTSSQAPGIAAGAAAGAGPTVAIGAGSNDLGGTIEITTGTSTTTGTLATITYGDAFDASLLPHVTITPANDKAAEHMLQWYKGTAGNTSFVLTSRVALDASTLYVFTYQVQQ